MFDNIFDNKEQIYEVYKEKSFSRAAKNRYISQPSLSAMVKRTEKSIGSEIFDRSSSPIRLTECGKQYIKCIEQIMELEYNFKNYIIDMKNLKTGSFSIGGSNLFVSYILPPLIMAFNQKYPSIKIELVEERTSWLIDQLSVGALDFIIENNELNAKLYERTLYQTEHLLLAVPRSLSINQKMSFYQLDPKSIQDGTYLSSSAHSVPLEQFAQELFIFQKNNNDTAQRSLKLCKQSGFIPKVLLYLDQQATAYNIACMGMGCCFVSDTLIRFRPDYDHVVYYKLQGNETERNIYFYYKHNKYLTFAMEEFLHVIENRT